MTHSVPNGTPGAPSQFVRAPGREEVQSFIRSYQTLLRSTGEVRVAGLVAPYLAMGPSLHVKARDQLPDAAALTYVGLRLAPCMPDVRLVLLSASVDTMAARGFVNVDKWLPQIAPARRRRQWFDGGDRLAIMVSSPSDVDDVIPALVAYEIEWNKLHELFSRDGSLRRMVERAVERGAEREDADRLASALGLSAVELERLSIVWQGGTWQFLGRVAERRKRLAVRMLGGTWNDYERAVERWYEYVANHSPPDLRTRPIYFVSSNMHSLVNLLSGAAVARQSDIIDYIKASDSELLRAEYEAITSERVPSSLENFLFYAVKKYLADPRNAQAAAEFAAEEHAAGMTTTGVPLGPDVDGQVIELRKLKLERIDRRLADLPGLDRLARSDALILNIDYPLGQTAYFLERALARNVGALLGMYVMGKGATLTGRIGDILLCNIVADERTANTYLLHNSFNAEDVERYLVYGTALDNQRAASAPGTFLQNWGYLDALHRAGNNLVEMEAGPYLEAFSELVLPERAPRGEIVNLVGAPIDLGFVHYASDTPYTKGQTLGERNLSYFGMDSTYAAALAIARRILHCEVARLVRLEASPASGPTDHSTPAVALPA
ncbi:MAG TPA: hypothetical protein VFG86_15780 [Chloroflexota bacterium]|nr:hypothetical protein [Chloroflexota bacterium]